MRGYVVPLSRPTGEVRLKKLIDRRSSQTDAGLRPALLPLAICVTLLHASHLQSASQRSSRFAARAVLVAFANHAHSASVSTGSGHGGSSGFLQFSHHGQADFSCNTMPYSHSSGFLGTAGLILRVASARVSQTANRVQGANIVGGQHGATAFTFCPHGHPVNGLLDFGADGLWSRDACVTLLCNVERRPGLPAPSRTAAT